MLTKSINASNSTKGPMTPAKARPLLNPKTLMATAIAN